MAELELIAGPGAPRTIALPVSSSEWVLGTGPSCEVMLEDHEVRERHARIRRSSFGYTLEPVDPEAGILLNGRGATGAIPLEEDDEIQLGSSRLRWIPGDDIEAVSMVSLEDSLPSGVWVPFPQGVVKPKPYVGIQVSAGAGASFHQDPEEVVTGDHLVDALHQCILATERGATVPEAALASLAMAFGGDRVLLYMPFAGSRPRLVGSFLGPAELSEEEGLTPSLLQSVKDAGMPVLVNTSTCTLQLADQPALASGALRSLMAAAIATADGEGTLVLDAPAERRRYQDSDQAVLAGFASCLAHLLASAERIRRMEEVIHAWSTGQQRLLRVGAAPGDDALGHAAASEKPVLVVGEAGTGKRRVALRIHQRSVRAAEPLQILDCAAEAHLAQELFGAEHTGTRVAGALELAHRGTLVLLHATALSMEAQRRLDEYLETGRYQTEGVRMTKTSEARLIFTSDRDPGEIGGSGWFLTSLYKRFSESRRLVLPPLREAKDRLEQAVRKRVPELAARFKRAVREVSPEALELLKAQPWPGNYPELDLVLTRAVNAESARVLGAAAVKKALGPG